MAYADLAAELAGTIPGLSPILAATHIRQAWREIRNERNWAFKTTQAALVCPAAITAGTATVAGATVTFDATATAALTPFLATIPLLTSLQIRFSAPPMTIGTPVSGSPLYRILAVTQPAPLIVTLDRAVAEPVLTPSGYMVYRAYLTPPVPDFSRWDSLVDYANGIAITGPRLTRSSVWFDAQDPQRSATNQAMYLGQVVATDPAGLNLYELWPHPTAGQTFLVTFRRTGPEFINPTDAQPDLIPDSLIMARALGWHSYIWAQANRGRFPALAKYDFSSLLSAVRQQYTIDLNTIRLQDDDLALQSVYDRGHLGSSRSHASDPPIGDAKYWQSHAIYW